MDNQIVRKIEALKAKMDSLGTLQEFDNNPEMKKEIIAFLQNNFDKIEEDNIKCYALYPTHVPGFDEVVPFLLQIFKSSYEPDSSYKWKIGNALETIGTKRKEYIEDMKKLVLDKKHGISRQMMVLALGKSKDESVVPVLIQLLDDKDVVGHVLSALAKFKSPELQPYFERFLDHKTTYIRNIAKRTIAQIEKMASKQI